MSVTSAPRAAAASAIATPCLPLERLPMKRTGSSGSRVPPAVTRMRRPARSPRRRVAGERMPRRASAAATIVVGLRHATRAAVGAGELADCRADDVTPRARQRGDVRHGGRVAATSRCASPGAMHERRRRLASTVLPSRSSARPVASFAIVFAVAGATTIRSARLADGDVAHLGDALVELGVHRVAAIASSVGRPTKRSAASVGTTWTSCPASTSARTTPTALYAAMPPVMPTTMLSGRRGPLACYSAERAEPELVLVDLVERDRQRLVVDRRVDERADVVEEAALVQVGVVVVDLAGALGREDHELVLRVDLREQVVDGRIDDAGQLVSHGVTP